MQVVSKVCVAAVMVVVASASAACGSGVTVGQVRSALKSSATESNQKDCAACEKMCKVAGEKEGTGGIAACVADCKQHCG